MKSAYRYRKERHFAQPPEAIWPFVADSARINEIAGMPAYKVEERADAQGRIHRLATIKYGPIRVKWEEDFGEWQENSRLSQTRHFINGPFGRFVAAAEVYPEGTGSRMVFSAEFECLGVLGFLAKLSGQIGREGDKRRGRLNAISHILSLIPYKKVKHDKIKLPGRSKKDKYDDLATVKNRRFVKERY